MVRQCLPKPECRKALLYFLTKTHKTPMTLRPIVSQVGSAIENLAAFLGHHLQPIVKELLAYLRFHKVHKWSHRNTTQSGWHYRHGRCELPVHLHSKQGRPRGMLQSMARQRSDRSPNNHQPRLLDICWNLRSNWTYWNSTEGTTLKHSGPAWGPG